MRFGRRRSSLAAVPIPTEPEPRRRNRLSKPPTANTAKAPTSATPSALSLQVPAQTKNGSTTDLALPSPISPVSDNGLRQRYLTESCASPKDSRSPVHSLENDSSWSVAYMVSQIEGNKTSVGAAEKVEPVPPALQEPAPITPLRPLKRTSILLRRISLQRSSSPIRTPSSERLAFLNAETTEPSILNDSLDHAAVNLMPPTRRSSFTPGTATRKCLSIEPEKQEHAAIEEVEEPAPSILESEVYDWQLPLPRAGGRSGTPSDMGYSQLGGLRHGSLQIVNGRASPAFSEASKVSRQLLAVQVPYRDVSSDYSDVGEESEPRPVSSGSLRTPTLADRRFFSWERGDDNAAPRMHPLQKVMVSQESEVKKDNKYTSLMADEYIAELGGSPFEQQRSASSIGTLRRSRSEGSLWAASSCTSVAFTPSTENQADDSSPVSPFEDSFSTSGSVIRRTSETPRGRRRSQLELAEEYEDRRCGSAMSWYSQVEPSMPVDEAYMSAVEFQLQMSPSRDGVEPLRAPDKSDSGYSSGNSLRSFQIAKRTPPPVENEAVSQISDPAAMKRRQPPSSWSSLKPSMFRSRKTSSDISSFATVQQDSMSFGSTPYVTNLVESDTEVETSKTVKARKKLIKKKRPLSQPPRPPPSQPSVVPTHFFERAEISQIPQEVQENLQVRPETLPELRQTYISPETVEKSPVDSRLDVSEPEISAPSPSPEPIEVKRPRSRSRPRSWFGRTKTDITPSRRSSGISQADAVAIIKDFCSDGAMLGKSHYDLNDHDSEAPLSRTPSFTSTISPPQRPMMDDETAAEVSRLRSRSFHERTAALLEGRPVFNDRGGIPGKHYRAASLVSDAPPITPAMLEKAYRTSSMQRQFSNGIDMAPPPPPHSPRPVDLDYGENEPVSSPPPPHAHSSRPIDANPDPWAAQAAAWKARRKSAVTALRRQTWDSRSYNHETVNHEPLYPDVPSRQQPDWTQCVSPEESFSDPRYVHNDDYQVSTPAETYHASYDDYYDAQDNSTSAYMTQSRGVSMERPTYHPATTPRRMSIPRRPVPSPSHGGTSQHHAHTYRTPSFDKQVASETRSPRSERSLPPPSFGRYSGTPATGYKGTKRIGGSAGTRFVHEQVESPRRGMALTARFGVDFGDVPIGIMSRG